MALREARLRVTEVNWFEPWAFMGVQEATPHAFRPVVCGTCCH